jgi:hypothetical protein
VREAVCQQRAYGGGVILTVRSLDILFGGERARQPQHDDAAEQAADERARKHQSCGVHDQSLESRVDAKRQQVDMPPQLPLARKSPHYPDEGAPSERCAGANLLRDP